MEADGIIAVSNSTLEDAVYYPEILKKPRRVIYHGVESHWDHSALLNIK